jgi:hypothetical protein
MTTSTFVRAGHGTPGREQLRILLLQGLAGLANVAAHCFFHCAHRLFPVRLCKECAQSSRAAPFFCRAQVEAAPATSA